MKNIFIIISTVFLLSCNSKMKVSQDILYIFPKAVERKISDHLKKNDRNGTYLLIGHDN